MSDTEAMINTESTLKNVVRVETVIIGAGPGGLSVGACLRRAGVPFVMLERGDRVGAAWHRHYDKLRLHTNKRHSALPGFPWPKHYPTFPSREQMIAYLESYARHFGLRPRFGQDVVSARVRNGRWHTQTRDTVYVSRSLVVATGYNALPHIPTWPGQDTFAGEIVHSSDYRNSTPYRGERVLVVGFGNSGGDIARDLREYGARPTVAVRSPVDLILPRDLLGIPILPIIVLIRKLPGRLANALIATIVRLVFGNLARRGLGRPPCGPFVTDHSWLSIFRTALGKLPHGPYGQTRGRPRAPLIDTGIIDLIRNGHVEVRPGVERFAGRDVVFTDGTRQPYAAVILATGYRAEIAFLERTSWTTNEYGDPRQTEREAGVPGLYLCGFWLAATGMLREIATEAKHIARDIAQEHAGSLPA